jgi:hypothetical protein
LKSHFQVAFAILVEEILLPRRLKDTLRKFRAHLDIAIHTGRLQALRWVGRSAAPLRKEVAASIRVKSQNPVGGSQAGVGEVNLEDSLRRTCLRPHW